MADAIRGSRPGRELCLQRASHEYEREVAMFETQYARVAEGAP